MKNKLLITAFSITLLLGGTVPVQGATKNKTSQAQQEKIVVANRNNNLITMNWESLQLAKALVKEEDPFIMPSYERLMRLANEALDFGRITVVDKVILPASGNKHDYMSFGPYWWPNPDTKDGLPYINLDGKTNPASKDDRSDSPKLLRLTGAIETLGMAYYFTGDKKYAKKASELLNVWFLNPETKMNPNLTHAQGIPGRVPGRAIGIIDSRVLLRVLDGLAFLEPSGEINKKDLAGIKKWFEEFNNWLVFGEYAYEERNWPNNHGTFYDVQVAGISMFLGDEKLAYDTIKKAQYVRMASHIGSKGQNFHELERANPFHYSRFDLEALLTLANYGNRYEDINFWNFTANKARLQNAVDYLVPYVENPESWPFKEKIDQGRSALFLLIAAKGYGLEKYESSIKKAWESNPENRDFLKWPQKIDVSQIKKK